MKNGQVIFSVVAAVIVGLSGWTLKTAKDVSVSVARLEQDELWIKDILIEQSRKFNRPKSDEK